jgi:hypothetical protein
VKIGKVSVHMNEWSLALEKSISITTIADLFNMWIRDHTVRIGKI